MRVLTPWAMAGAITAGCSQSYLFNIAPIQLGRPALAPKASCPISPLSLLCLRFLLGWNQWASACCDGSGGEGGGPCLPEPGG